MRLYVTSIHCFIDQGETMDTVYVKSFKWESFLDYRLKKDSEEKFRSKSFDSLHVDV